MSALCHCAGQRAGAAHWQEQRRGGVGPISLKASPTSPSQAHPFPSRTRSWSGWGGGGRSRSDRGWYSVTKMLSSGSSLGLVILHRRNALLRHISLRRRHEEWEIAGHSAALL